MFKMSSFILHCNSLISVTGIIISVGGAFSRQALLLLWMHHIFMSCVIISYLDTCSEKKKVDTEIVDKSLDTSRSSSSKF